MRKLFLHFAMSADGMVSNVEQWVSITDEAMKDGSDWHDAIDTIIIGKNNYAPLASYWHSAETLASSSAEREFAKKINAMHKIVLSHGAVDLVWRNSELLSVKDNTTFQQAISKLKAMPGKDIAVDSGEGTWRSFLENDLWDGIDILLHPVVMGSGRPLLDSLSVKSPLHLVANKTYSNGLVNLRYERI